MPRKPRFKPEITRVKLNPEQAVLACACFAGGYRWAEQQYMAWFGVRRQGCMAIARVTSAGEPCVDMNSYGRWLSYVTGTNGAASS